MAENIPSPKAKVIRRGGYVFVGNLEAPDKGLRGDVGDVHFPQVPWGARILGLFTDISQMP